MTTTKSYVLSALLCKVILSHLSPPVALAESVTVSSASETLRNVAISNVATAVTSAATTTPGFLGTALNPASFPSTPASTSVCVHTSPSPLEWSVSTNTTTTSVNLPPMTITVIVPASTVTLAISQIQPPTTAAEICFWDAADILTLCTALFSATHTSKTSNARESKTNLFLAANRYFEEAFKKLQVNITSDSIRSAHDSSIPAHRMCGVALWVAIGFGLAVFLEFWGYIV